MVGTLPDVMENLTALINLESAHKVITKVLLVFILPFCSTLDEVRLVFLDTMLNLRLATCTILGLLCVPSTIQAEPTVAVLNGSYQGVHSPPFDQDCFLGIPYAQNAGGRNRFRIPQSLNETWSGSRLATNYSHACPDATPEVDALYGMSEDCLSINIVRPAGLGPDANLPVMTWIHGGSYQVGTSGLARYNLSYIVQQSVEIRKPIVATSINYRKGG